MEKLGYAHVAWVNACNRIGEENMWSVRLGWVGCRSINFCDDSPFAYILSGAGTFCLGFLRLQGFFTNMRSWNGKRIFPAVSRHKASKAGLHGAYT